MTHPGGIGLGRRIGAWSFDGERVIAPAASRTEQTAPLIAAAGMRIGLLGGSFNPAHSAHLAVSADALKRLRLDRVWWLVSPQNPLKSRAGIAPFADRMAAARALAGDPRIIVTDFEYRAGTRYAVDTVRLLQWRWPEVRFVWLAGADILSDLHRWRSWLALTRAVPMAFFDRPSFQYRALASRAAVRLRAWRVDESDAAVLASLPLPAWSLIHGVLNPLSATALRKQDGY